MAELYIDDGYTLTKTLDAEAGYHAELSVVYRPALYAERRAYQARFAGVQASGDPKKAESLAVAETDAVAKYVVTLNGDSLSKEKAAKLHPIVVTKLVDLIFSYLPADEAGDAKN